MAKEYYSLTQNKMTKFFATILILVLSTVTFGQDYSGKSIVELEKLKTEALKKEDYKLAGQINDEIKKRESDVPNSERIIKAKIDLKAAVAKEDYALATEIKKEIELREKLEVVVKNENYAEAAAIQKQLNGDVNETPTNTPIRKNSGSIDNSTTQKPKDVVFDPNFDEANYNATVNVKGHTPPRPGKAAIYLIRVSALGFAVPFKYFNRHELVGESKGVSYVRTEVDPGDHVFWTSAENQSYITINAVAGKSYLVYVDVKMGMMSAQVNLSAVLPEQDERILRGVEVINGHDPSVLNDADRSKILAKLEKKGFVQEKMNEYETKLKGSNKYDHIPAQSFIPNEKLK